MCRGPSNKEENVLGSVRQENDILGLGYKKDDNAPGPSGNEEVMTGA